MHLVDWQPCTICPLNYFLWVHPMSDGISIVVCCHNSAKRLPETLQHLAGQRDTHGISFELVLVDNGSSDGTASVASQLWAEAARQIPMRVVQEPELGLSYARSRGIREAKHDIISFVDDDNWVSSDWVARVHEFLASKPDVAACGGLALAAHEVEPPSWFEMNQKSYAVGEQASESGDVTWSRGFLWGAGLSLRQSALADLKRLGFSPLLTDRKGGALSSGGDQELCLALRLAGWRLWYNKELRLRHFMPAERMKWGYLRRLKRAFGVSAAVHEAYRLASEPVEKLPPRLMNRIWLRKLVRLLRAHARASLAFAWRKKRWAEGNPEVLEWEYRLGRILGLLQQRDQYDSNLWRLRRWASHVSQRTPDKSHAMSQSI